jgi:hypothetical protein
LSQWYRLIIGIKQPPEQASLPKRCLENPQYGGWKGVVSDPISTPPATN